MDTPVKIEKLDLSNVILSIDPKPFILNKKHKEPPKPSANSVLTRGM
jgi:hypothetical protein